MDNKLKELEAKQKEALKAVEKIGEEIKKLKKEQSGFDFMEWYNEERSFDCNDNQTLINNNFFYNTYESKDKCIEANNRRVAEYIISEHFKRIVGDWKPNWSNVNQDKYHLFYNYDGNCIDIREMYIYKYLPNWFYFPEDKIEEIIAEVEHMKTLYGVDIVKYYLTGER